MPPAKQTLTSGERYITQELKELESKILGAHERLISLERRLFDELLESIHREGVEYIMTIGADLPTSYAARELAERYDFVYFAAGIHPEQAGDAPENYLEELKALAAHPKCRAIGEIGLDYYWAENPPKERQMELFRQQVLLAKELGLPVIIHDREAHADTLALLRELHPAGVLHCFSGSVEMAKEVAALGMYLGFTGAITFKNARKAPQAAAVVPDDRLLIETDCPYMAPEPYRGKRCDSSMLPRVAERLAEIRGVTPEEIIASTCRNAKRLFGIG